MEEDSSSETDSFSSHSRSISGDKREESAKIVEIKKMLKTDLKKMIGNSFTLRGFKDRNGDDERDDNSSDSHGKQRTKSGDHDIDVHPITSSESNVSSMLLFSKETQNFESPFSSPISSPYDTPEYSFPEESSRELFDGM